ncbi:MAG: hypothetical protein V4819_00950 [Verrucomicrobiota bacterium]
MKTANPPLTTPAKQSIRTRNFEVIERWIEVSAEILHSDAEKVTTREGHRPEWHQSIFTSYATDFAIALHFHRERGSQATGCRLYTLDSELWENMQGRKLQTVSFSVKESQWRKFLANCDELQVSPVALIRAAYAARIKLWRGNTNRPAGKATPASLTLCAGGAS